MLDVEIFPVLWYLSQDATHYHFKLTFVDKATLDFWGPSTTILDAILDVISYTVGSALQTSQFIPRFYPSGSTFPVNGSLLNTYSLPSDAYFDWAELIPWVDLDSYESFSAFQAFLPMFMGDGDVYYAKATEDLSEVPASIPGYAKLPQDNYGGWPFTPDKGNYQLGYPVVARLYKSGQYTSLLYIQYKWIYEGKSDEHPHILWDWTHFDPLLQKVYDPDDNISIWPDFSIPTYDSDPPLKVNGWNLWKFIYTYWFEIFLEGYTTISYPYKYYPTRDASEDSGSDSSEEDDELPFLPLENASDDALKHKIFESFGITAKIGLPAGSEATSFGEGPIEIGGFPINMSP